MIGDALLVICIGVLLSAWSARPRAHAARMRRFDEVRRWTD